MSAEKRNNKFMSPLAKARGLGSTQDGARHWLNERIAASLLLPLVVWVVYSILMLRGASYEQFTAWMQNPLHAMALIVFFITSSYHAVMGLQVVMEDYISCHCLRLVKIVLTKIVFGTVTLAAVLSILKVAL